MSKCLCLKEFRLVIEIQLKNLHKNKYIKKAANQLAALVKNQSISNYFINAS